MDTEVLIAGAGPTGLVLAIELARRGVNVRIVDKAEAYPTSSRGDALVPRTLTIFDDLGVLDEVLAVGHAKYPVQTYRDGELIDRRERAAQTGRLPNIWLLGQARTEQVLRDRLAAHGVRVQLGTEVTGFSQDADAVTVHLRDAETIRAAYLVGADGGKSFVRQALGVPFPGTTDETLRMMICDVVVDGLDLACAHWFTRGLALVPVSGQPPLFQLRAPISADTPGAPAGVQALLDHRCGAGKVRLRDLTWSTVLRSNLRVAERFRTGRVFLAGDAAHVHPPTGSYGLNTGVEDAYNLGWKLAAALSTSEQEELLETYHLERKTVASRIQTMITGLMRKYAGDEAAPDLDLSYRHSPLSVDERAEPGTLHAGDRAPDALVLARDGRPTRLFELFHGTHATVLAFGQETADPPDFSGEVRTHSVFPPDSGGEFTDHKGQAFGAYDVLPGTQILVRPDGYVAAIRSARSSVSSNTIRPSRS
ncbi:FAD-binding protein [Kibdelosporangium aridum]|uniref:FAD-binding protein n=1 Tax=Kibdelosporangium aridum TaxID=2030 RepID=A0A428Z0A1_KIBAR|nr:FAD-dependent monooxygenase [Kibdelosporangium aridum]RSM77339.1 FAD-binding protein [Kibdelosporangium aridum]